MSIRNTTTDNDNKQDMELLFKNGKEYLENNIDDRQKQIELITKYLYIYLYRVTNQIEDLSKTTNQMVVKQGEKISNVKF